MIRVKDCAYTISSTKRHCLLECCGDQFGAHGWDVAALHRDYRSCRGACVRVAWLDLLPQHGGYGGIPRAE
ncbi:hypothetical protein EEB13_03220 [Rhodococcus sp. WS3]|nr:hypothetical protein EEB13_03220 [Rhodococcus sp. WS3]